MDTYLKKWRKNAEEIKVGDGRRGSIGGEGSRICDGRIYHDDAGGGTSGDVWHGGNEVKGGKRAREAMAQCYFERDDAKSK